MFRRTLLLFSFVLLPASVWAASFLDTEGHPHAYHVDTLQTYGIVEGYGYGIFRPDIPINRAEFLKILMLAVYGEEELNDGGNTCFTDFAGREEWYWKYACLAKSRGVIGGYPDGSFRGAQTVNLAEAMKIAVEAWDLPYSDPSLYAQSFWYIPYFEVGADRGLFNVFPNRGDYLLTRSDMAYLIVAMGEPIRNISGTEIVMEPIPPQSGTGANIPTFSGATTIAPYECGNGIHEPGEECDDGNILDGDGCSSLCILVGEPVHHAALKIEQRPTAAGSTSGGTDDLTLFAFDAIAGRQDVDFSGVIFKAAEGDLDDGENYRLYVDSNGDGITDQIVQTVLAAEGDTLTFNSFVATLPEGVAVRFELKADLRTTASSGDFGVTFATENERFIEAQGTTDGRDLSGIELNNAPCVGESICWIAVHTIDTPLYSLVNRGNLYVTEDSSPVRSHQILGSQASEVLLRLNFRAEGEEIEVTKINFENASPHFTQVLLYEEGETFPFETAWTSECDNQSDDSFCANTNFTVKDNQEKTILVRAVAKADTEGGVSGQTASIELPKDGIEARGRGSQEEIQENDGDSTAEGEVFVGTSTPDDSSDIKSPTHDLVLARIKSIENGNGDVNGSSVPTGTATFGVFLFEADEHTNTESGSNEATIQKLIFTVNASNILFSGGSFELVNMLDTAIAAPCTESDTTGSITVTCSNLHTSSVSTAMESGDSIALGLRAFIANGEVESGSSTLQASLQNLGSRSELGTIEWNDGITTFGWVDIDQIVVNSTTYSN